MDRDFRAVLVVMVAGSIIVAVAATLLFFTFRAFGTAKRGDIRHIVLLLSTIGFIVLSCIVLLMWSVR